MSTGSPPSISLLDSDLVNLLQRQIDAETILAGLNGELTTSNEIRLRAAVSARQKLKKTPIKKLEKAIAILNVAETKHIARKEVAAINALKKKFLVLIYPAELRKVKGSFQFKKNTSQSQSALAHNQTWASCQLMIETKFGSPAPAEWAAEAHHWAHRYNQP